MLTYHDLMTIFRSFGFRRETPILAHIGENLSAKVIGGLPTFMGALLSTVDNVVLPAFTFSTMVTPQTGPVDNALEYGVEDGPTVNHQIFSHLLPSEVGNQEAIEILQTFPGVLRSEHPVLSFFGLGMDIVLLNHTPDQPYHPIEELRKLDGWVLLADTGADQNFSIHYAEMLAGRKQFIRWALTPDGVAACTQFPGCPNGFHKLDFYLHDELLKSTHDDLVFRAVRLSTLISTAVALLKEDPFALLCNDLNCVRCNLVREDTKRQIASHWRPESPES